MRCRRSSSRRVTRSRSGRAGDMHVRCACMSRVFSRETSAKVAPAPGSGHFLARRESVQLTMDQTPCSVADMTNTMQSDVNVTGSSARAVVRCATKGCKPRTTKRVEFRTEIETRAFDGRMSQRFYVVEQSGRRWSYRGVNEIGYHLGRGFSCDSCGSDRYTFKIVDGRYSAGTECGPRCTNAVGPSCDCKCGGDNHAAGHGSL